MTGTGLGCAPIANMYRVLTDDEAVATVRAAWDEGVRYFDTAPHYGLGVSERRLGLALRGLPRDEFTVSTKVGRLLVPEPAVGGELDGGGLDDGFMVPATHRRVWDFSADGIRRSLESSLERLGLDHVDLVLLHDPENRESQAIDEGYAALHELRSQGVVTRIGAGSTQWQVLERFVEETELDVVMLAGRMTLLEQPALPKLLPACVRRGVQVINVGVFNSGILAVERPHAGLHYEYGAVPQALLDTVIQIADVCEHHGVSLPMAALAYAAAHPAVADVAVGADTPEQARRNTRLAAAPAPPPALWDDLVERGLLDAHASPRAWAW